MINSRRFMVSGLVLLFAMIAFISTAQTVTIPTINQQAAHSLKSKITGTNYHLSVSLPQHYSPGDTSKYPVLYILDGGIGFPIAHSINGALGIFADFPKVIIVAIEYDWKESLIPWYVNRTLDYTPTRDTAFENNPAFRQIFALPQGALKSGGAPAFLDVIRKEIIPFIEKQYKTNGDRGISGHSFGGLFAGYCLLNATDLFSKFGINSPSFWWQNRIMFKMEKAFSEKHTALPVKVFMSVGGDEGPVMTPVMTAFADTLRSRNYKGLELTTNVFDGENHISVVPAMMSRTLRVLYEPKK